MYEVDVLIAGAGIAGVLTASKLSSYGFKCLLVEPKGLAAEQSGHSHGYIHRGYIYLRAERSLVDKLKTSREQWEEHLSRPISAISHNDLSLVGFENPNTAEFATKTWASAGLPVNPLAKVNWPAGLIQSNLTSLYQTDEASFDFTKVLSNVMSISNTLEIAKGAVKRLIFNNSFCRNIEIDVDGKKRKVVARYVVLACGRGNAGILSNSFGHFVSEAAPTVRTSYMLIAKGDALKSLSLILPENPFYGLFMVSRKEGNKGIWLISNYLSYGGKCEINSVAATTWTKATLRVLHSLFPLLKDSEVQWGIYAAPKAELRRDPSRLPDENVIESFGIKNVSLVWPTKLTLGPLITKDLVKKVANYLGDSSFSYPSKKPTWITDNINVCKETWHSVDLFTRREFEKKMGL